MPRSPENLPPLPTVDNMADVFNPRKQRETEAKVMDYSKAATLPDLYAMITKQEFIFGDEGERLEPRAVMTMLYEQRFNEVPKFNGLRENALRLIQEHTDHRLEF